MRDEVSAYHWKVTVAPLSVDILAGPVLGMLSRPTGGPGAWSFGGHDAICFKGWARRCRGVRSRRTRRGARPGVDAPSHHLGASGNGHHLGGRGEGEARRHDPAG